MSSYNASFYVITLLSMVRCGADLVSLQGELDRGGLECFWVGPAKGEVRMRNTR